VGISSRRLYCCDDRSGVVAVEAKDIAVLLLLGMRSGVGGILDALPERGARRDSSPVSDVAAEWPSSLGVVECLEFLLLELPSSASCASCRPSTAAWHCSAMLRTMCAMASVLSLRWRSATSLKLDEEYRLLRWVEELGLGLGVRRPGSLD
jgi:hypothetical protein